jgi:hypothetical protein
MGFAIDAHCPTHDAGGNGLPCPWPECPNGCPKDTIERPVGAYVHSFRRSTNITDEKRWYTWQRLTRPR